MQENDYEGHIARLREEQDMAIKDTEEQIHKWEGFKSDYEALKQRLTTLPDQVSHDVMVPFGKMAFMPGKLVHTNEILVLLGDNWFADRSAKQAVGIVNRRIKEIDKQLEDLNQQRNLIEPRRDFTCDLQEISREGGEAFEIREEYDEDVERKWKEQHKDQVKKHRQKLQQESGTHTQSADQLDTELWARLDELERIEREGKEMLHIGEEERVQDSRQYPWKPCPTEEVDSETQPGDVEEVTDEDYTDTTDSSHVLDSDDEDSPTDDSHDDLVTGGKIIHFSHSTPGNATTSTTDSEKDQNTIHPGTLYSRFNANRQPKSILKKTVTQQKKVTKKKTKKRVVGFDTGSDTDEHSRTARSVQPLPSVPAFTGTVLEKSSTTQPSIHTQQGEGVVDSIGKLDIDQQTVKPCVQTDSTKPVSRFKARKQNKTCS